MPWTGAWARVAFAMGGTGDPVGPLFGCPKGWTVKPCPKGIWVTGRYARARYSSGSEKSVEFEVRDKPSEPWDTAKHAVERQPDKRGRWRYRWTSKRGQEEVYSGRLFAFLQYGETWRNGKLVPYQGDHKKKGKDGKHVKAGGPVAGPSPQKHGKRHREEQLRKKAKDKKAQQDRAAVATQAAAAARAEKRQLAEEQKQQEQQPSGKRRKRAAT